MKHRPPRIKVTRKQINAAINYEHAVEAANQMQSLGFRTMIEGGAWSMNDGGTAHYLVYSWQKPVARRETV